MANYDYRCNSCSGEKLEDWIVIRVSHGINEKPKIKCPKCGGTNTEKCFIDAPDFYVRGYGWLDVKGRRNDMNLYKLMNDDPYGSMRQKGEKDELANQLRKKGKHNPNRKYI